MKIVSGLISCKYILQEVIKNKMFILIMNEQDAKGNKKTYRKFEYTGKFEPGDLVETTEKYIKYFKNLTPFRGVVVDYPGNLDGAVKVCESSGHIRYINPAWLRIIPFDRFCCYNNMCKCNCHQKLETPEKISFEEGEVVEVIEVRPIYKPKASIMDIRLSRISPNLKPRQKIRIIIE